MRLATTSRAMPLASRSRPSIPASRAWRTRKSGWSLSSRCGRPARDGPPRVGSLPRLSSWRGLLTCLAFAAWWQDVKWEKSLQKKAPPRPPPLAPELLQERVSTTGRFGGKTPGEIDLHPSKHLHGPWLAAAHAATHHPRGPASCRPLALGCPQAGRGVLTARAATRAAAAPYRLPNVADPARFERPRYLKEKARSLLQFPEREVRRIARAAC